MVRRQEHAAVAVDVGDAPVVGAELDRGARGPRGQRDLVAGREVVDRQRPHVPHPAGPLQILEVAKDAKRMRVTRVTVAHASTCSQNLAATPRCWRKPKAPR